MDVQSAKNFIANLRLAMDRKGVSQRDLASKAKSSYAQLNRILQSKSVPTLNAADQLAKAIGFKLADLLDPPADFQEHISEKISA